MPNAARVSSDSDLVSGDFGGAGAEQTFYFCKHRVEGPLSGSSHKRGVFREMLVLDDGQTDAVGLEKFDLRVDLGNIDHRNVSTRHRLLLQRAHFTAVDDELGVCRIGRRRDLQID